MADSSEPTAREFYGKPFAPSLHIILGEGSQLHWQWGQTDSLHAGNFAEIDSLVHRYISLYLRPNIEINLDGSLTRREVDQFFDSLKARELLPLINAHSKAQLE